MEWWTIYHRYCTVPDKDVPLRDPAHYTGDVAAIGNGVLIVVRDGRWVEATRKGFDEVLIKYKCIKPRAFLMVLVPLSSLRNIRP